MNNRHKNILPESYATYFTQAVDVPIMLTADGLKFWIRFYGITKRDLLTGNQIDTALERRGIYPGQYWIMSQQPLEEIAA